MLFRVACLPGGQSARDSPLSGSPTRFVWSASLTSPLSGWLTHDVIQRKSAKRSVLQCDSIHKSCSIQAKLLNKTCGRFWWSPFFVTEAFAALFLTVPCKFDGSSSHAQMRWSHAYRTRGISEKVLKSQWEFHQRSRLLASVFTNVICDWIFALRL